MARARARVLPLLDRLAAHPARRPGRVNRKGMDFYRRLVDGLARARHRPGGDALPLRTCRRRCRSAAAGRRATPPSASPTYAGAVAGARRRVAHWITHNEPWGVAFVGHAEGTRRRACATGRGAAVAHTAGLPRAGGRKRSARSRPHATSGSRSISLRCARPRRRRPMRGGAPSGRIRQPVVPRPAAARRVPRRHGRAVRARVGLRPAPRTWRRSESRSTSSGSTTTTRSTCGRSRRAAGLVAAAPAPPTSALGWSIDPAGLRELLGRLVRDYGRRPLWITENGVPDDLRPTALEDTERVPYLSAHSGARRGRRRRRRRPPLPRLVPARQLRMGARVRGAVRARARRLRDATPHAQAQRPVVPRLHRRAQTVLVPCPARRRRGCRSPGVFGVAFRGRGRELAHRRHGERAVGPGVFDRRLPCSASAVPTLVAVGGLSAPGCTSLWTIRRAVRARRGIACER